LSLSNRLASNLTRYGQKYSAMNTEKMTEEQEDLQENTAESNDNSDKKHKSKKLSKQEQLEEDVKELTIQLQEQKDKFLRLYAEFDNFKKRTAKERLDLIKTAGQDIVIDLLPVLDDFDRAEKSLKESDDVVTAKEGFKLIKEKMLAKLESKGLMAMDAQGKDFDVELHEAITEIPAPKDALKGKVVDVVEKGYTLNQKIIRYAKVVIGK
jgi:molecular chaperone GrpE